MIQNKSQSINIDESLSKVLIYALLFPSFNTFLKGISSSLNLPEQILSGLLFVLYIVVYGGVYKKVGVKYILEYIKILVVFLFVLLTNYYLFPNTRIYYFEYFNNFRQVVIIYLPAAVAGSRITNFSIFFGKIRFMAYSGVLLSLVTLPIYSKLDYMAFALQILPLSMSLFVIYFDKKNKYDLIMFLVSSVMILLAGSRMSLFSLVLFIIFLLY